MLHKIKEGRKEESIIEDLEKASNEYCVGSSYSDAVMEKPAFKAGANWQFEKMMKDAVEAEVMIEHRCDGIYCKLIAKSHLVEYAKLNCSDGDKVRVIIIKED